MSKRSGSAYREGRSRDWLKVKCARREEFVVVGFTEPRAAGKGIGALLLATRSGQDLVFAGRVGSGFTERFVAELRPVLEALELPRCPLPASIPASGGSGVHWVQPQLVVEVAYAGWTSDGLLRHPSFKGLRDDVPSSAVRREVEDAGGTG
jgi:bifunctional non-homologous end joining protein LigD